MALSKWVGEKLVRITGIPTEVATFLAKEHAASTTVPFLARYRKDQTKNMSDLDIRNTFSVLEELKSVEAKRERIFADLEKRNVKIDAEVRQSFESATSMAILDELHEPFKIKRESKAEKARQAGYEDVAKAILSSTDPVPSLRAILSKGPQQRELLVALVSEFLYRIPEARELVGNAMLTGKISSAAKSAPKKKAKGDPAETSEEEFRKLQQQFKLYSDYENSVKRIKPHQILAIFRGEKKGALKVSLDVYVRDLEHSFVKVLAKHFVGVSRKGRTEEAGIVLEAVSDAYTKHVLPSAKVATRRYLLEKASESSIRVFSDNLRALLLQRPLANSRLLVIDPGFKAGCKSVVLDESGKLLDKAIFNLWDKPDVWKRRITELQKKLQFKKIAIGNGTASREVEKLVSGIIKDTQLPLEYSIVSEIGASVYSASAAANEEFPDLDILYRGAVSIGRRLQNPLSELVKIPPRSIGVGMYQHDINEKKLEKQLVGDVEYCVADVGVDVNLASKYVLKCLPGMNGSVASHVVEYRDRFGKFNSRDDLKKVKGLTDKVFQSVGGFLRVKDSKNPLDNTICHPESYPLVKRILKLLQLTLQERAEVQNKVESTVGGVDKLADKLGTGLEETKLLVNELTKPAEDPRVNLPHAGIFRHEIVTVADLKPGMATAGVVRNVTDFGAFVDIGVGTDALLHAKVIERHPGGTSVGAVIQAKVEDVDSLRKRISISFANSEGTPATADADTQRKRMRSPSPNNPPSRLPVNPKAAETHTNALENLVAVDAPRRSPLPPLSGGRGGSSAQTASTAGGDSERRKGKLKLKPKKKKEEEETDLSSSAAPKSLLPKKGVKRERSLSPSAAGDGKGFVRALAEEQKKSNADTDEVLL